jgi:flagellar biogenesis protein FliO
VNMAPSALDAWRQRAPGSWIVRAWSHRIGRLVLIALGGLALLGGLIRPAAPAPVAGMPDGAAYGLIAPPDLLDLAVKLVIVFGLLFLFLRVMRRYAPGHVSGSRNGTLLQLVESRALPGRSALHLVRVGERAIVVGQSQHGLVQLAEIPLEALPDLPEVAPAADPAADFATLLARAGEGLSTARGKVVARAAKHGDEAMATAPDIATIEPASSVRRKNGRTASAPRKTAAGAKPRSAGR